MKHRIGCLLLWLTLAACSSVDVTHYAAAQPSLNLEQYFNGKVDAWGMFPQGDSEELRQKRIENFLSFLGPGGLSTPDDVAALEGCQRGFAVRREAPWSDISRGMGQADPKSTDELQMRAFWRRWNALMTGIPGTTDCADHPERIAPAAAGALK